MIRTAEQILADMIADDWDDDPESERHVGSLGPSIRRAKAVSTKGLVDTWPRRDRWCEVAICDNPAPEHKYCSGHRRRLNKHGDLKADVPLRRRGIRVERIGDVWLAT